MSFYSTAQSKIQTRLKCWKIWPRIHVTIILNTILFVERSGPVLLPSPTSLMPLRSLGLRDPSMHPLQASGVKMLDITNQVSANTISGNIIKKNYHYLYLSTFWNNRLDNFPELLNRVFTATGNLGIWMILNSWTAKGLECIQKYN